MQKRMHPEEDAKIVPLLDFEEAECSECCVTQQKREDTAFV